MSNTLNYEKEYMLIIKYAQSAREDVFILRIKKKKKAFNAKHFDDKKTKHHIKKVYNVLLYQ